MKKFKNEIQGLIIIGLYLGLQFIYLPITWIILSWKNVPITVSGEMNPLAAAYSIKVFGVIALIFICLLLYIYRVSVQEAIRRIKKERKAFFKKLFFYFLITEALIIGIAIIDNILFSEYVSDIGDNQEYIEALLLAEPSFLLIITLTVLTPILEEIAFRYALISKLMHRVNKYLAATITVVVFAFAHVGFEQLFSLEIGNSMHLFLTYLPSSLALTFIYVREDDLTIPILLHIFNNTIAVLGVLIIYGAFA